MASPRFLGFFLAVLCITGLGLGYAYLWYTMREQQENVSQELSELRDQVQQTEERAAFEASADGTSSWYSIRRGMRDAVAQVFCHLTRFNWLEPYKTPEQGQCMGSAFFISIDGDLITNAHVVNQAQSVFIQIPSQGMRRFDVEVVCICMERDLALLRLTPDSLDLLRALIGEIPVLGFGDSDTVQGSDEIMTLGYPLGQHSLKCTTGIVSGREHIGGHYMIQISAPINPGNSGGPTVNRQGDVVGVNTSGIDGAQNVNYNIPSNEVLLFLRQFDHAQIYEGSSTRLLRKGFFGFVHDLATEELTALLGNPAPGGYYIVDVCAGSLADKAGIKAQDMIYSINKHPIDTFGELTVPWSEDKVSFDDFASRLCFGDRITLEGYRKGKKFEKSFLFEPVTLPPVRFVYPGYEPIDYEILGGFVFLNLSINLVHTLLPASPQLVRYADVREQMKPAVVITHIMPDSVAMRARIITRPGIIVAEVNGIKIGNLDELREALKQSAQTGLLSIKTSEGQLAVYPFPRMLAEEEKLSRRLFYPITKSTRALMKQFSDAHGGQALSESIVRVPATQSNSLLEVIRTAGSKDKPQRTPTKGSAHGAAEKAA